LEHPFAGWLAPSAIEHETYIGAEQAPRLHVPGPKRMTMGLFTRDITTTDDLFIHQLQDVCYAEKQLVKDLSKMAEQEADLAGGRQVNLKAASGIIDN
jgi:hypothetical protein